MTEGQPADHRTLDKSGSPLIKPATLFNTSAISKITENQRTDFSKNPGQLETAEVGIQTVRVLIYILKHQDRLLGHHLPPIPITHGARDVGVVLLEALDRTVSLRVGGNPFGG